ncbi:hypothetical protein B0T20DRAFT_481648 [Sordaria brevicollis]|uniref:Uncharacterized protein n=1 Tax=Sordaria brevicollis TaxID=83679 RepID=A0AAE0PBR3_SORBR|nr:hypothetical protein B0T20DRAFT_481648 [Sordaria brevicollis]
MQRGETEEMSRASRTRHPRSASASEAVIMNNLPAVVSDQLYQLLTLQTATSLVAVFLTDRMARKRQSVSDLNPRTFKRFESSSAMDSSSEMNSSPSFKPDPDSDTDMVDFNDRLTRDRTASNTGATPVVGKLSSMVMASRAASTPQRVLFGRGRGGTQLPPKPAADSTPGHNQEAFKKLTERVKDLEQQNKSQQEEINSLKDGAERYLPSLWPTELANLDSAANTATTDARGHGDIDGSDAEMFTQQNDAEIINAAIKNLSGAGGKWFNTIYDAYKVFTEDTGSFRYRTISSPRYTRPVAEAFWKFCIDYFANEEDGVMPDIEEESPLDDLKRLTNIDAKAAAARKSPRAGTADRLNDAMPLNYAARAAQFAAEDAVGGPANGSCRAGGSAFPPAARRQS